MERAKEVWQIRVVHGFSRIIGDQVLLRHISHVVALIVFRQEMVKRLFLTRTAVLWDRSIPFICVGKFRIDIKNHTAKRMFAVANNLSEMIFGPSFKHSTHPHTLNEVNL